MEVIRREFYRVDDVMIMLEVGRTKAFEIIKQLNLELEAQGKIYIRGRVSKRYFDERMS